MTRLLVILLALIFTAGEAGADAASDFASFFREFRALVARHDAKAVAERTQLPFLFEGKPRDRDGFQKIYPELFDQAVRTCFKNARAARERDRYSVSCGRYIFYFGLVGKHYRLIEFAADPEAAS